MQSSVAEATADDFTQHLNKAYKNQTNVAFETNFNNPIVMEHVQKAKKNGFRVKLTFIGLANIKLAEARVRKRVKDGGHKVSPDTIAERYNDGLKVLDNNFKYFDQVSIYESFKEFKNKLAISIDDLGHQKHFEPSFLKNTPTLQKMINPKNKDRGIEIGF